MSQARRAEDKLCRGLGEQLAALAAGELAPQAAERLWQHLQGCEACRQQREALQAALRALQAVPEVEPPPGALEAVLARLGTCPAPAALAARYRRPLSFSVSAAASLIVGLLLATVALRPYWHPGGRGGSWPASAPGWERGRVSAESGLGAAGFGWGEPRRGALSPARAGDAGGRGLPGEARRGSTSRAEGAEPPPAACARARALPPPLTGRRGGGERLARAVGGRSSFRPSAIKANRVTRPGPARKAAPLPSLDTVGGVSGGMARGGPAAARSELGKSAGEIGAEAGWVRESSPALALPRARALGAGSGAAAAPARERWSVADQFWQIRVEVPQPLVQGVAGSLGVVIVGRAPLAGLRLQVTDASGGPLGAPIEVGLVPEGQRMDLTVPVTAPAAGKMEAVVTVEAVTPALRTSIPVVLWVSRHPPASGEPTVALALREVPLGQAAATIAHQAHCEVEVAEALAEAVVDADFSQPLPVGVVLELLAEQVGGRVERTASGFRLVEAGKDAGP
jgi:hypothetical protein